MYNLLSDKTSGIKQWDLNRNQGAHQGGKCRDISAIYRRNIVCRRLSTRYFLEKWHLSREIADFSRYIGDLAINRRFFSDISRGQRGSTKVKPATVPVNALQCLPVCLLLRGFEPQTKRFRVHPLTTWAKLPFDT